MTIIDIEVTLHWFHLTLLSFDVFYVSDDEDPPSLLTIGIVRRNSGFSFYGDILWFSWWRKFLK